MKQIAIGLSNLHFCFLTKDDATGATYETEMVAAPGVTEVGITVEKAEGSIYADDILYDSYIGVSSYTVSIDIATLPESLRAKLAGHEYDESTGTVVEKATDSAKEVGIAFKSLNSDGSYKFVKLFKGKFAEAGESYKTKGEQIEYQTKKLEGKFYARIFDGKIKESTDNATTAANWFTSF